MKERIIKGWNLKRMLYVLLGVVTMVMAIKNSDWLVGSFGMFVTLMGVLSLGCASVSCQGTSCNTDPSTDMPDKEITDNIEYEEVK